MDFYDQVIHINHIHFHYNQTLNINGKGEMIDYLSIEEVPWTLKKDIIEILDKSGLGLPRYMEWKSRSGCFFCFYQSKLEWINLYERHPNLYKKAMDYSSIAISS